MRGALEYRIQKLTVAPARCYTTCTHDQGIWDDEQRFVALYKNERYLRLCAMMCAASDAVDRAWACLLNEVGSGLRPHS
jgi:hypothetical protein